MRGSSICSSGERVEGHGLTGDGGAHGAEVAAAAPVAGAGLEAAAGGHLRRGTQHPVGQLLDLGARADGGDLQVVAHEVETSASGTTPYISRMARP